MSELVIIQSTTDLEDLERQKRAYDALPTRLKMRSNDYCIMINGINNEELYNILKANILYNQSTDQENYDLSDSDGIISTESTIDKYLNKIESCTENNLLESYIDNNTTNINEFGVEINVPPITPYFTPDELSELVESSDFLNEYSSAYPTGLYNFNYVDSLNKIKELYEEYINNPTDIIKEEITLEISKGEYFWLGLRMIDGVSIIKYKEKYNSDPFKDFNINDLINKGLLIIEDNYLKLTELGLEHGNYVFEHFI